MLCFGVKYCLFSGLPHCAVITCARVDDLVQQSNYISIQEGSEDVSVGSLQLTVCVCAEPWA